MVTYRDIETSIKDYYLIAREVERLKGELNSIELPTSRYSNLPKGSSAPSGILNTVIRRDEKRKDLTDYEGKIELVERYSSCIIDMREKTVLNCLLDNMTITEIAHYLQMSKQSIYNLKDRIIQQMLEMYKMDKLDGTTT